MTEPEQFHRLELLIGAEGLARLQAAHVTVAGLGAVGSYATEALARAGVGHLRLVDFDTIHPSNLNRQLYALHSTVGLAKVDVARARVLDISPRCQVEALRAFIHAETMDELLAGPPDFVIDAIDAYAPKLELLCALTQRGLPAISSMGAALRTDPARVQVGTLSETCICPLARQLRKGLRRRGLPLVARCVYSDEPVSVTAVEEPDETEVRVVERGRRRRRLGSLPTITALFGLLAAHTALESLLQGGE